MKLHNRTKESTFAPLNDHHEIKPNRGHRGNHVILKRDKRARIIGMLEDLKRALMIGMVEGSPIYDIKAIIKEGEK